MHLAMRYLSPFANHPPPKTTLIRQGQERITGHTPPPPPPCHAPELPICAVFMLFRLKSGLSIYVCVFRYLLDAYRFSLMFTVAKPTRAWKNACPKKNAGRSVPIFFLTGSQERHFCPQSQPSLQKCRDTQEWASPLYFWCLKGNLGIYNQGKRGEFSRSV